MIKMKITWKTEARDPQEWIIDRGNPPWAICAPVEDVTKLGWLPFLEALDSMSPRAWQALLWALRKQDELRLPINSIEIDWSELIFEIECPFCKEWVTVEEHECDLAGLSKEEEPAEEPPAKGAKKKPGEPAPEA